MDGPSINWGHGFGWAAPACPTTIGRLVFAHDRSHRHPSLSPPTVPREACCSVGEVGRRRVALPTLARGAAAASCSARASSSSSLPRDYAASTTTRTPRPTVSYIKVEATQHEREHDGRLDHRELVPDALARAATEREERKVGRDLVFRVEKGRPRATRLRLSGTRGGLLDSDAPRPYEGAERAERAERARRQLEWISSRHLK